MKHTLFQDSRIGPRTFQQDRLGQWSAGEAMVLVLADGMGGHQGQKTGLPDSPRMDLVGNVTLEMDELLLCSDGFWGPLTQREILMGLVGKPPAEALPGWIEMAEARVDKTCGNVSVLAIHWLDDRPAAFDEPPMVPMETAPPAGPNFTASATDFLRVTDAEIESQIAQIKATLGPPDAGKKE